jgi:hypothetical protein
MLKEGTLPAGYGVRKRKLVRLEADDRARKGEKVKKSELAAAVRKQNKSGKKKRKLAA